MASEADREGIYELAFAEGIRVLEGQARTLEQLRVRMAALLAMAVAANAFLIGIVAKASDGEQDRIYWAGVIVGVGLLGFVLWSTVTVLQPKYEWHFNLSPKTIIDGYADHQTPATLGETHRELACILDANVEHNQANLYGMQKRLSYALVALVLELACWACLVAKVA